MSELAEIRTALAALQLGQGRIEGTVNGMADSVKGVGARIDGLDTRMRGVETAQAHGSGRSTIIGTIAAAFMAAVFTFAGRQYGG